MMETLTTLGSRPQSSLSLFTRGHTLKLACVAAALLFCCVFASDCLSAQGSNPLQTAEEWAAIAKIRSQIANDHEIQSENMVKGTRRNSLEAGDLLNLAGDEKFLAADNYQMASQQWDKAATAYLLAGAFDNAQKARENAKTAIAAAKRALNDGVYFHIKSKEQYEVANDLDKKMNALDKAARNLERLMKINEDR